VSAFRTDRLAPRTGLELQTQEASAGAPFSGTLSVSAQGGNAAAAARIESELAVTYNTKYANTLLAGSRLDWFWDTYSKDTTNPKPGDLLN
jgi:hypothetical protein